MPSGHRSAAQNQFSRQAVLVLTHGGPSLAAIRSLADQGFTVVVGRDTTAPRVERSRHASELWVHPEPDRDEHTFLESLLQFLRRRPDIAFVFPVGERHLTCLARHADALPTPPQFVMPSARALVTCLDKRGSYELAAEAELPVPRRVQVAELASLYAAADELGYPCVVKPVDSLRPFLGRKAIVLSRAEELRTRFASWPAGNPVLLLEEYLGGYRHNCQFAAVGGELIAYFEHRSTRTDRVDGTGNEVDGESIAPTPALRDYTARITRRLGYSGVGCVQFLLDPGSGRAGFMEINPRLDGMCEIARACGFDFPALAVQYVGQSAPPTRAADAEYPAHRRIHWLQADVQGLIGAVGRREIGPGQAAAWTCRLLNALACCDVQLTWSWTDPVPTVLQYARFLRTLCRGAVARIVPGALSWPVSADVSRAGRRSGRS